MADTRTVDLAALAVPADADLLHVIDVSDATMNVAGTDKQMTMTVARTHITAAVNARVDTVDDRLDAYDAAPPQGTARLTGALGPGWFGTAGSTMNLATGVAYFAPFIARANRTVGSFFVAAGSTAPTTPVPALGRVGLYTWTVDTWTLVARCASDTTLWTAVDVPYTEPFATADGYPASYTLVAGAKYALGFLVVGTGTMTARCTNFRLTAVATALDAAWRINSQTDLPVTQTQAGLTAEAAVPWGDLIAI